MRYKKLSKRSHRPRIKSLDQLIQEQRAQLNPIENSRVTLKLLNAGQLDLSTSRPLDLSTSQPLDLC